MFDIVQLILRMSYYYSRLLGVVNFEINTKTGVARITRRATIYAAVVNTLLCCIPPLMTHNELIRIVWKLAGQLHEYLVLVVMGMRIICVLATLFSRWSQRRQFVRLINTFQRLTLQRPQVIRMWRNGVIQKFLSIFVSEVVQIAGTFLTFQSYLNLNTILSILSLYMLAVLVNVIISHFYFAMLNVHIHYMLLKQELTAVLADIRSLEYEHRKATFMNKCCSLADQLEDIARRQSELQMLYHRLIRVFGLQGITIALSSYISSIGCFYFSFSAVKRSAGLSWSPLIYILLIFEIGVYYMDIVLTMINVYRVIDDHAEFVQLLQQYTMFTPRLDKRLDAVFESFQLQLSRNQFNMLVLGLYNMNKPAAMAMANSIVTSSLVLIQYELENSSETPPAS